jgi:hypothetical protein
MASGVWLGLETCHIGQGKTAPEQGDMVEILEITLLLLLGFRWWVVLFGLCSILILVFLLRKEQLVKNRYIRWLIILEILILSIPVIFSVYLILVGDFGLLCLYFSEIGEWQVGCG